MTAAIAWFEASRLFSTARSLLLLMFLGLVAGPYFLFGGDTSFLGLQSSVGFGYLIGLLAHQLHVWTSEGPSRDTEYLFSRMGDRLAILKGRWLSQGLVGLGLCLLLAIALASHTGLTRGRVNLSPERVAAIEKAGFVPAFRNDQERLRFAAGDFGRIYKIDIEVPWLPARMGSLALLSFLLGVMAQAAYGPKALLTASQRFRDIGFLLSFVPLAPLLAVGMWPVFGDMTSGMALQENVLIWFITHSAWVNVMMMGLIVSYGSLAWYRWKRADLA